MPGAGVRIAARLLTEIVGKHFPTAEHLAVYAESDGQSGSPGASERVAESWIGLHGVRSRDEAFGLVGLDPVGHVLRPGVAEVMGEGFGVVMLAEQLPTRRSITHSNLVVDCDVMLRAARIVTAIEVSTSMPHTARMM